MSASPRWSVPQEWNWVTVSDIADVTGGGTPSVRNSENFVDDGGIPWITPADLTGYEGAYISRGKRNLSDQGYAKSSAKLLPTGAVLFTSRAPIGYCAIASNPIATNQGFKSLTLYGGISAEYTRLYLKWSKPFLETMASGTTFLELSGSKLQKAPFPLPPLAEQKRIVTKLDALSARSTRARGELDRIDTLVKRYKQAVLSKAFSGELTAQSKWKPCPDDFAVYVRSGQLPAAWKIEELGSISEIQSGLALGKKRKADVDLIELPYLRVANVQRGWLALDEIKTVGVTEKEAEKLFLHPGDILMNEGGDRDKLGRGWVWEGQIDRCIHQNHVFRVRLQNEVLPPRFVSYFANAFGQRHFFDQGKQTTNLASISKSKLSAMQIPVPSFDEAQQIVRRIESAFGKIDRLAAEAKRALELTDRLDEAILAKAFRGELVPQDPDDEPASVLLERIKAERAAAPKAKRGRGRGKKEKA
ncbi:restriction endonuclease subunit S [Zhengella sp. ZM62]|uniref:restriction endonuclease subunit S n=1 Tax=Zhengella sedimenti TaxID=3390035 RepID=UPI0039747C4C